jgi:vacuolar-type H+-ATPase subunit E/Vma4
MKAVTYEDYELASMRSRLQQIAELSAPYNLNLLEAAQPFYLDKACEAALERVSLAIARKTSQELQAFKATYEQKPLTVKVAKDSVAYFQLLTTGGSGGGSSTATRRGHAARFIW